MRRAYVFGHAFFAPRKAWQSGGRLRREEGLLAAFCPGGEEEGWTALAGSELAVRLGL